MNGPTDERKTLKRAIRESPLRGGAGEMRLPHFSSAQQMGRSPFSVKNRFTRLKGREPKKPRRAERGLGWGDWSTSRG